MKKKQLTILLASTILVSNVLLTNTYTNATKQTKIEIMQDAEIKSTNPTVENRTYTFDRSEPKDIVITGVNFDNTTLTSFAVSGKPCDKKYITCTNDTITISKDFLSTLTDFKDDTYQGTLLEFTNTTDANDFTQLVGYVTIKFIYSSNTIVPSTNDDNTVVKHNPTIGANQVLDYDLSEPKDVVVRDVDFDDTDLSYVMINGTTIRQEGFTVDKTNKTITILASSLKTISLAQGVYDISFKFTDSDLLLSEANLRVINSVPEIVPPTNGDTDNNGTTGSEGNTTPENTKPEKRNPQVNCPTLNYYLDTKPSLTIDNVDFDNTNLSLIIINGETIYAEQLELTDSTITIPKAVLEDLKLIEGNYYVSYKFSDSTSLIGVTNLSVKESATIVNTTPLAPIVIDKNNLTEVTIPNFIPANSKVESVVINNKVLTVKYKNARRARLLALNTEPEHVVYIDDNNNLIIPAETLEYIGFDEPNYDITANLADGSKINKTVTLNVANPPSTDNATDTDNNVDANTTSTSETDNNSAATSNIVKPNTNKPTSVKTGDAASA
ncbi:MAG: hypothetical protein K5986_12835 [Clostridium sp.]|nr:hypothetical protein [Clostridium sp.]